MARLRSNFVSRNKDHPKLAIAIPNEILRNFLESSMPPSKATITAPAIGNQINVLNIFEKEKGEKEKGK
ncbi:hypothetical protein ABRG53_0852 [Pseudanabaena sp. ABRG5-3]|nr:hypothetical protein ABRG53_0852 [Pseudanabaena sp. ABRG5-3]